MSTQRDTKIDRAAKSPQRGRGPARHLSTAEAAARLGVTERTVRRAITRGDLLASKSGGVYRLREPDVAAYAARTQRGAAGNAAPPARHLPEQLLAEHAAANSSYVTRRALQADLTARLRDPAVRIVTLTGPGGAGKSRLAMAASSEVVASFPDGVVYIPLATIFNPALVAPAIAQALWVKETAGQDLAYLIAAALNGSRRLLVLDNFEQILPAAPLVSWMAAIAPECTFLITSRAPLHVRGEQELPVPPMPVAAANASPEELLASEAGQLFVARVREHVPAFVVDAGNAPLVAAICAQLDGLPLAIELAATRVKMLGLEQLRQHLHHRLHLLAAGPADAPHRHSTMRNAIAWSYDLLSEDEQRVFRQLAVCVGGCTLDASLSLARLPYREEPAPRQDVTGAEPEVAALEYMATLVDHSLLTVAPGLDGALRYGMLETIREFAVTHLSPEEQARANTTHARFFLDLAWRHRPLVTTRATSAPMSALAADLENIRAALEWLDHASLDAEFARLVAATYTFMFACGHFAEGVAWLQRAQAKMAAFPPLERALLQVGMAEHLMVTGDHGAATAAFAEILPLARAAGTPFDLANALISSGVAQVYNGEHAAGEAHLQEALALANLMPDRQVRAAIASRAQANLSVAARAQGHLAAAAKWGEAALERCRAARLEQAEARILIDLGDIARDQGYYTHAIARYQAFLLRFDERGEVRLLADALGGIASALAATGYDEVALPLFDTASRLRERTGYHLLLPTDLSRHEQEMAAATARLGAETAASILGVWHEQPFASMLRLALSIAPEEDERPGQTAPAIDLTPREEEVLYLLLQSLTDREIAAALHVSPRTVSWHVRHILDKLGASTRRDAIARARRAGLPAPPAARAASRRPDRT
ncbi:MAG: LuxR C-terminal-related transcriptional regulator [Chloroflexota bacterium]|nr:LuxR C-terminal-related transcriptional regulator [Chloroflexota bacterium]